MSQTIGRFEIRSELGRGAQSVVYLAWDPQLQREVAIKTLHFGRSDVERNETLLKEARTVSQLRHSNIVPIFDAGIQDGDPYLVFEYVEGGNLEQHLRKNGKQSPLQVARYMLQVLGGIGHAHAQGIVHRDLKPSNILLDASGLARVMDFGIAMRVESGDTGGANVLVGTPAFLSPEYVKDQTVSVQGDVYAAGLVMMEMLSGHRVIAGENLPAVLYRIVNEPVALPEGLGLDDTFADLILKSVAHNPSERYPGVQQLKDALQNWLDASGMAGEEGGDEAQKQSTLAFLLRRMRHKSDFPALSDSVAAINKLTTSDRESIGNLSNTILRDYALTNKILRIVNAAYYRQSGGGQISTVSRAVVVLGFDAIRNVAITVLLFEHMQDKANVKELREAFLRANLAGIIGRDTGLKHMPRAAEEAFICSLFQGLGELLAQFYFPEEVEQIRRLMAQKRISVDLASAQVLGLSFEDLGIGIARTWGFPPSIITSMRALPDGTVKKPNTQEESLRVVAGFANEMCDVIASVAPADRGKALAALSSRFAGSMPITPKQVQEVLDKSANDLVEVANILHANLKQSPLASKLRSMTTGGKVEAVHGDDGEAVATVALQRSTDATLDADGDAGDDAPMVDAQAILAAGIQDISNSLVDEVPLNDILRIILETVYRAMGFDHVLLCLRDAKSNSMLGRFGFGPDAGDMAKRLKIPLSATADVFHVAVSKGVDVFISDIDDVKIADRIPPWYRQHLPGHTFVLFPLMMKSMPVALMYCSKAKAGSISIPEKELALLKTLRNQALLAIKQTQAS